MSRKACVAVLMASVVAGSQARGASMTLLDQQFENYYTISYALDYPGDYLAQTFTLRNSGLISTVGLQSPCSTTPSTATVLIYLPRNTRQ